MWRETKPNRVKNDYFCSHLVYLVTKDDFDQISVHFCGHKNLSGNRVAYKITAEYGEPLNRRTCMLAGPWLKIRIHQKEKRRYLSSVMIKVGEIGNEADVTGNVEFSGLENEQSLTRR